MWDYAKRDQLGTLKCNTNLQYSCDGAARWQLVPVEREPGNTCQHPQEHTYGAGDEPNVPTFTVLHPYHEHEPNEPTGRHSECVPVEEACLLPLLHRVGCVELFAAESRQASPCCPVANGDKVETQEKQTQV
jgi:hypothetical protein